MLPVGKRTVAKMLLSENCPQDSFPGFRNPLRIVIRGKFPPDHPLLTAAYVPSISVD